MGDTIFAEATAPGRAGVAIIRISGPQALSAAAALTPKPLPPRKATLRDLRRPDTGALIDQALILAFPGPASFTGEDVVELHCHGSRAVVAALLDELGDVSGLRPAEPGEFTRRALANGRLDLAEVEGLADLLAAETEAQRRQAVALAGGQLSRAAAEWRDGIVAALARLEAVIDFADEDLPDSTVAEADGLLAGVEVGLGSAIRGAAGAERLRTGFEVALVGPPNVGKSTLLNAIAGRSVAITSPVAGTTRDVIEFRTDLRGLPVTFLDMAGLRDSEDPVEREGVERARTRAEMADVRIFLNDGEAELNFAIESQKGDLSVRSKADACAPAGSLAVSGRTGTGVDVLLKRLATELEQRVPAYPAPSQARQREAIQQAAAAVARARRLLGPPCLEPERVAADLQLALRSLDFLVGRVDVEAVLDVVFQTFCLGK